MPLKEWFQVDKIVYFKKKFFCAMIRPFSEFVILQLLSHVWLLETPGTATCQLSPSPTVSWSLHTFVSMELVMPSNRVILCRPLLLPLSIFPGVRFFLNESVLHITWPKDCNFSFNISPSSEYSGLISFRMEWFHGSQESSPAPQFEGINSLALSLYGPALPSIRDYWKNHIFD